MKNYELLCVFPGTLTEDEVKDIVEKTSAMLVESGAQESRTEDMGKHRLAYPMKHIRFGYFRLFLFQSEPEKMAVIREKIRLIPQLLRVSLTIYNPATRKENKINYLLDSSENTSAQVSMSRPVLEEKKIESVVPEVSEPVILVEKENAEKTEEPKIEVKEEKAEEPETKVKKTAAKVAKAGKKPKAEAADLLENFDAKINEILEKDLEKI